MFRVELANNNLSAKGHPAREIATRESPIFERRLASAARVLAKLTEDSAPDLAQIQDTQDVLIAALVQDFLQASAAYQSETVEVSKYYSALARHIDQCFGQSLDLERTLEIVPEIIEARARFLIHARQLVSRFGIQLTDGESDNKSCSPQLVDLLRKLRSIEFEVLRKLEESTVPNVIAGFDLEAQKLIFKNTFALELNRGCTVRCSFCGVSAVERITDTIKFGTALWFIRKLDISTEGKPFLYYRSDPFDYQSCDAQGNLRTYIDLLRAYRAYHSEYPFTSTAYPAGARSLVQHNPESVDRFSVSKMNLKRISADRLFEQTASGNLVPVDAAIAEGILFNYLKVSPFLLDQLITGALNPRKLISAYRSFGSGELYFFSDDNPAKISGRQRRYGADQIIGNSIGCFDGVVIGNSELRNSLIVLSTPRYPDGLAEVTIKPEKIARGARGLLELIERLKGAEVVNVEEVLSLCIVKRTAIDGADRVVVKYDQNVKQTELFRFSKFTQISTETDEPVSHFEFFYFVDDYSKYCLGRCEFNQVTGEVMELDLKYKN